MKRLRVVAMACIPLTGNAQFLDADNLGEAATMGAMEFQGMIEERRTCSSLLPEHEQAIQSLSLQWLARNRLEQLAVLSYTNAAPGSWKSTLEKAAAAESFAMAKLPDAMRRKKCETVFGGVRSGSRACPEFRVRGIT